MNNFYDKTFPEIVIIDDYNPSNIPLFFGILINHEKEDNRNRRRIGKVLYYGTKLIVEVYVKPNFTGIWIYGISYLLDYIDTLNN